MSLDIVNFLKALGDNSNALATKSITINGNQTVDRQIGSRFSLRQWLHNIGRDSDGMWDFQLSNGYYPIYEDHLLKDQEKYTMLEFAMISLEQKMSLMDSEGQIIIRIPYGEKLRYD